MLNTIPIAPGKLYGCLETLYKLRYPAYLAGPPGIDEHERMKGLLCPACAAFNCDKRGRRTDLTGRVALVTGGRIKIGYQTALRMLRDGAQVLVTLPTVFVGRETGRAR